MNASWVASSLPRKCSRPCGRDLAQHRDAALVLAGGHFLVVDVVPLQQAVEVGDLRDDADRTDQRERRGDDAVGGADHQIAAARRHLVDAGGHFHLAAREPHHLGRREAVAGHRAARALDLEHDFVGLRPRDREHGVDLGGEPAHRPRPQIALEIEDEDALLARARARLLRRLGLAPRALASAFSAFLSSRRELIASRHDVVALVERANGHAARPPRRRASAGDRRRTRRARRARRRSTPPSARNRRYSTRTSWSRPSAHGKPLCGPYHQQAAAATSGRAHSARRLLGFVCSLNPLVLRRREAASKDVPARMDGDACWIILRGRSP